MKKIRILLLLLLAVLCLTVSRAENEPGIRLNVDQSHAQDGYIIVQRPETDKKLVVVVEADDLKTEYPLENDTVVLPLQFGCQTYHIGLFDVSGSGEEASSLLDSVEFYADMEDSLSCFLHPNLYVQYTSDSPWVLKAEELTAGIRDPLKQYRVIINYIVKEFSYDYIKTVAVKENHLPDIQRCWDNRMGDSQDLAALVCAMLRSRGIPAMLFRTVDWFTNPYCWIVALIGDDCLAFDPAEKLYVLPKDHMLFKLYEGAVAY